MFILYTVLGFEPMTFRTRVYSHNHWSSAPTLPLSLFYHCHYNYCLYLEHLYQSCRKKTVLVSSQTNPVVKVVAVDELLLCDEVGEGNIGSFVFDHDVSREPPEDPCHVLWKRSTV